MATPTTHIAPPLPPLRPSIHPSLFDEGLHVSSITDLFQTWLTIVVQIRPDDTHILSQQSPGTATTQIASVGDATTPI